MGLTDLDNYLPQRHSEIFQETYDSDSLEDTQQRLGELVRAWLFGADAGLFFRTSLEMQAMSDGYEEVFWPELQGKESCEIGQIFVACKIPSR